MRCQFANCGKRVQARLMVDNKPFAFFCKKHGKENGIMLRHMDDLNRCKSILSQFKRHEISVCLRRQ